MSVSPSPWACRALDVPHAHGGLALPVLTQVAIVEQFGRVTNALGWCYGEAQGWMFEAFNDEQIERLVMPITRGESHLCYAITEEDAGSDPAAMATTAERRGEHYLLNGEKWHVTSANLADTIIVQARIAGGANDGAHCLFFPPRRRAASATCAHRSMPTPTITITRSSPSRMSGSRPPTASAARATAWASPMPGSGASA